MKNALLILVIFVAGCADKSFVNIGSNRQVPKASVTERARQQGITFDEALREMRAEVADADSELMAEARRRGIMFELADRLEQEQGTRNARRAF